MFKDKDNRVIYIGKALSLRDRVRSYFNPKLTDTKTRLMVGNARDLEHFEMASEFEALLLEANLIKKYQPKYNLALKDDKHYLYIAITKAPYRIFPVRRPELEQDLLDWFGPYPSGWDVRQVLRTIRRVYPYSSDFNPPKRETLYAHIGLSPSYKELSSEQYRQDINKIRKILRGKTASLKRELTKKMLAAAEKEQFEYAQEYKNQLTALEYVTQGWKTPVDRRTSATEALYRLKRLLVRYQGPAANTLSKIEGYDISNLGSQIIVGSMVVFVDGEPEKGQYRKFRIRMKTDSKRIERNVEGEDYETQFHLGGDHSSFALASFGRTRSATFEVSDTRVEGQDDTGAIRQVIGRRLNHPEWLYPQLMVIDGGKGQVAAAFEAIAAHNLAGRICLVGLAKKEETIIIPKIEMKKIVGWRAVKYSRRSQILQLLQQVRDEAHRFAQRYYKELHRKTVTK